MKASQTFAYQKFAVHSRQHTPLSQWSVSGTHKAQEIKAVNKGPSDKGSPDSYESLESWTLAVSSFRTRADGHEKTNHRDEHEGRGLHLALPISNNLFPSFTTLFTVSYAFPSFLMTTVEKLSNQNPGNKLSSVAQFFEMFLQKESQENTKITKNRSYSWLED